MHAIRSLLWVAGCSQIGISAAKLYLPGKLLEHVRINAEEVF